ncbi:TraR/DksA C4-type zinc finger protein [Candidatus Uhrbacteria bacterium]|nr:TraR/DksA C4-type zinc finger protein [Candidatus Uhrbacteria bacterium]
MDEKTLKEIEQRLLEEKDRLLRELNQFTRKNPHNPDDYDAKFTELPEGAGAASEEENAYQVTTYSDNLSMERTLESLLKDVNKALARLAKGEYGTCRHCGKPIDPKRLLARPTSSSCIECKKRLTE